jgi:hypothetical protein
LGTSAKYRAIIATASWIAGELYPAKKDEQKAYNFSEICSDLLKPSQNHSVSNQ